MKIARFALALLLALSICPRRSVAQENAKAESKKPATTLKLQVTFSESEGEKKVTNLPYSFFIRAVEPSSNPTLRAPMTKVRMGSRVPVYAGKDGMQYIDVGTNIDASGVSDDDGRFEIDFALERSWVEGDVVVTPERGAGGAVDENSPRFKEPIIRQFKTNLNLTMHDGQTIQTTQAADPLSGRILTISVTMNVVK
jgi:hypothetical protein